MGKRGAQKGNLNAIKHGFYAETLTEEEKLKLQQAEEIGGLDAELALLRFKLRCLLKERPDRIDLQIKAVDTIARVALVRHIITPKDAGTLKDLMMAVIRDVTTPLEVKHIPQNGKSAGGVVSLT